MDTSGYHSLDALRPPVSLVMVAQTEGPAREQDVDEKMDEELPVKSGLLEWC